MKQENRTPAYVFDLDILSKRVQWIQSVLEKERIGLCYAMKANPFLISALKSLADRLEVCSPGEFRICEREQIPMERIVVSGVNKEQKDLKRIVETYQGQGIFTIESKEQLYLLNDCAMLVDKKLQVLIRLTSGNQFGVDLDVAKQMIAKRREYPWIDIKGIQYYSGTQKKKLAAIEKELYVLKEFTEEIQTQLGYTLEEIEYGPGLYVPYFQKEESCEEELLQGLCKIIHNMQLKEKITLEMGRFVAADCGSYYTTIVDKKENAGQVYGIVDGGIHQLNYYGQTMAMKVPNVVHYSCETDDLETLKRIDATEEKWNICGSLCTTADVIVKQLPLKGAQIGDVLEFQRTGAYSMTEGISLFLSRDLPQILFYSKEQGLQLIRNTSSTDVWNSKSVN